MKLMGYNEYQLTYRDPTPDKYIKFLEELIALTFAVPPLYLIDKQRFATPEESKEITLWLKGSPS